MDAVHALLAAADFAQDRLSGSLDAVTKFPSPADALAFRPGPGRAHAAWQFLHIAATLNKYVAFINGHSAPGDVDLVNNFGGGSTPSDQNIPSAEAIRKSLDRDLASFRKLVQAQDASTLDKTITTPGNKQRTMLEVINLMIWHTTHHQGQIHLTLNLYKAAKAIA